MPHYSLDGRVALVTGGAQGIGHATGDVLIQRGATVVLVDLDRDHVEQAAATLDPVRAIGVSADVTDRGGMQRVVADITERFGGLDIVVANAGVVAPASTFLATPFEHFERVIDVNLGGVCRTVDAALPEIVRRQGHVVVTSSIAAFRNGYGRASYAMSKAAVEQFGHALRLELVPHGAGASVVYFGLIDTPMVATSDTESLSAIKNRTIPRRLRDLTPPDVAGRAIVDGIERRQARIFCPRAWAWRSALRGIQLPIGDYRKSRDALVHQAIRALDGGPSA